MLNVDLNFAWQWDSLRTHELLPSLSEIRPAGSKLVLNPAQLVVLITAISFFFGLDYLLQFYGKMQAKDSGRIVGLMHASFVTLSVVYFELTHEGSYIIPLDYQSHSFCSRIPNFDLTLSVTMGFFCWDLFVSVTSDWGLSLILHGLVGVYTTAYPFFGLHFQRSTLFILTYETSTLFLNTYQLALKFGYQRVGSILKGLFAIVFFLVRVVFGTFVKWEILNIYILRRWPVDLSCYPEWVLNPIVGTPTMSLLFYLLNLYWAWLILRAILQAQDGKADFASAGENTTPGVVPFKEEANLIFNLKNKKKED